MERCSDARDKASASEDAREQREANGARWWCSGLTGRGVPALETTAAQIWPARASVDLELGASGAGMEARTSCARRGGANDAVA